MLENARALGQNVHMPARVHMVFEGRQLWIKKEDVNGIGWVWWK
jgi:hypothetical protein